MIDPHFLDAAALQAFVEARLPDGFSMATWIDNDARNSPFGPALDVHVRVRGPILSYDTVLSEELLAMGPPVDVVLGELVDDSVRKIRAEAPAAFGIVDNSAESIARARLEEVLELLGNASRLRDALKSDRLEMLDATTIVGELVAELHRRAVELSRP